MKKIVIAPDSFKGTLSAIEVANILATSAAIAFPNAEIITLPIADGGEGSLDCFESFVGGQRIYQRIMNPMMEHIIGEYLLLANGTAIIESAMAIGLNLVGESRNPMYTTSYGVGELIKSALDNGAKEIILALGGSSTNDGGIGMAIALGAKAYNDSVSFLPTGGTLNSIKKLDLSQLDSRIKQTKFVAMCDVENLPFGKTGATYVYARQKGATDDDLPMLEQGIITLEKQLYHAQGNRYNDLVGGGAAGALGMGAKAFLNAELKKGIEVVLDLSKFDSLIKGADWVITGEGKLDEQSLMGKVISGISKRTTKQSIKLAVVAGVSELDSTQLKNAGISHVFTTNPRNRPFAVVKKTAKQDLIKLAKQIFDMLK